MVVSASSSVQQARQVLADRLGELMRQAGLSGLDIANLIASLRAVEGMFVEWQRMERAGLRQAQEARRPLYERTRHFRSYSSWLIPGLIQTRAYTHAALSAIQERRGLVDDVEAAVDTRMERQRVLHYGDHRFAFLIEESVLRTGPGGHDVLAGQLGQLISVASMPNVSLGIVPMRPGRTRWPAEGFWIFDSGQVNVELTSGYLTLTQPREGAIVKSCGSVPYALRCS
jgi:hypothetical protein